MVIPMNADPWTDRLSEYVDDELAPAERLQLEQHLLDCARCREIVDELRDGGRRGAGARGHAAGDDLWPAIAAALPRAAVARLARDALAAAGDGRERSAHGGVRARRLDVHRTPGPTAGPVAVL